MNRTLTKLEKDAILEICHRVNKYDETGDQEYLHKVLDLVQAVDPDYLFQWVPNADNCQTNLTVVKD